MRHARINFLGQVPGSTRLFVPDLNGRLYMLPPGGGTPSVYLDVRAAVGSNFFSGKGMGSGFGFVAFDPDFATNGRFYTTHSEAFGALQSQTPDWTESGAVVQSVLTEWTATNPAATTFSGTHRTLMRLGFASFLHAIQQIDFNPTGRAGRPRPRAALRRRRRWRHRLPEHGSADQEHPVRQILRINPRGTNSANGHYGIPANNPFVGQAGTLGEFFAIGMRDPAPVQLGPGRRADVPRAHR